MLFTGPDRAGPQTAVPHRSSRLSLTRWHHHSQRSNENLSRLNALNNNPGDREVSWSNIHERTVDMDSVIRHRRLEEFSELF